MTTSGTLLFRCRLCGEVTPGVHVVDISAHLDDLIDAPKKSARISRHRCRHGAWGITDLCGANGDVSEPLGVAEFHALVTKEEQ